MEIKKVEAVKLLLILTCLFVLIGSAKADEPPFQENCQVEAQIVTISSEQVDQWKYHYIDIGISIRKIEPALNSDKLPACLPLTNQIRTYIVRIYNWDNYSVSQKPMILKYDDGQLVLLNDNAKLKLSQTQVGNGVWPIIIGAELIERDLGLGPDNSLAGKKF